MWTYLKRKQHPRQTHFHDNREPSKRRKYKKYFINHFYVRFVAFVFTGLDFFPWYLANLESIRIWEGEEENTWSAGKAPVYLIYSLRYVFVNWSSSHSINWINLSFCLPKIIKVVIYLRGGTQFKIISRSRSNGISS